MKKIFVLLFAVCMICCCFAACGKSEPAQEKYVIYCGLNDADSGSQILKVEDAQAGARKIITDGGFGYTEYVTYGAYTEDGAVKGNDTLVYALFYVSEADANSIASKIKRELNLASVLVERVQDVYYFAS